MDRKETIYVSPDAHEFLDLAIDAFDTSINSLKEVLKGEGLTESEAEQAVEDLCLLGIKKTSIEDLVNTFNIPTEEQKIIGKASIGSKVTTIKTKLCEDNLAVIKREDVDNNVEFELLSSHYIRSIFYFAYPIILKAAEFTKLNQRLEPESNGLSDIAIRLTDEQVDKFRQNGYVEIEDKIYKKMTLEQFMKEHNIKFSDKETSEEDEEETIKEDARPMSDVQKFEQSVLEAISEVLDELDEEETTKSNDEEVVIVDALGPQEIKILHHYIMEDIKKFGVKKDGFSIKIEKTDEETLNSIISRAKLLGFETIGLGERIVYSSNYDILSNKLTVVLYTDSDIAIPISLYNEIKESYDSLILSSLEEVFNNFGVIAIDDEVYNGLEIDNQCSSRDGKVRYKLKRCRD